MHEKVNLSAPGQEDTRKYRLAVFSCWFILFRAEKVFDKVWIFANRETDIRYNTEVLVKAARMNEKGNCGYSRAAASKS